MLNETLENHKGVAFVIENGNDAYENNELNTAVTRRNKWYFTPNTGKDILNHLITVTKEYANNCIKLLTIAGHGHSSYNEYNGIPGKPYNNNVGLYYHEVSPNDKVKGARSLNDLKKLITLKDILFCKSCLIELYSCRKGLQFALKLASITGCEVIFTTGSCGRNMYEGESGWISGPKYDYEISSGDYMGFFIAKPDGSYEKYRDPHTKERKQSSKYTPK